jgi:hypothetical protein
MSELICRGCGSRRHVQESPTARWFYECKGKATAMGSLNEFHKVNVDRQHEAFAPPHSLMALVVCVQEEVGELAGCVLGVTGEKKRKAHKTKADALDGVADAITYLSLVAASLGCDDLEKLLGDTFNIVSDRAGSSIKTKLGQP